MIDAIIFDKDGTLFDFRATWGAWAERLLDEVSAGDAERRHALARAIRFDSATGFHPSSVAVAGTPAEIGVLLEGETGRPARELEDLVNRLAAETVQREVTGLAKTLALLAERHVLGVVTNDGEALAHAHLGSVGIAHFFAFVAGYDSGHGAKPDPGSLQAFSRATGTAPERTLMVGDSRHDLEAGRAAGMGTVAVLTGLAEASELADLADVVLPDITHLPEWIGSRV